MYVCNTLGIIRTYKSKPTCLFKISNLAIEKSNQREVTTRILSTNEILERQERKF